MKRATAILLCVIHLMDVIGYYGIFVRLEQVVDEGFAVKLNMDEFSGSDAITLRIPLSLPYPIHRDNYERVEGKFEFNGHLYQMAKQKLHNDTLYVVCVRDDNATKVKGALNDLIDSMTGHPAEKHQTKAPNSLVKDFESVSRVNLITSCFVIYIIPCTTYTFSKIVNCDFSFDQPPRA